jgi:hypothetical protein
MRVIFFSLCLFVSAVAYCQFGGNSAYKSLGLVMSARAGALGGSALGIQTHDISLSQDNPALLDSMQSKYIGFNTTFYMAGINYGSLMYAQNFSRAGNFLFGIRYIVYGKFDGRDIADNPTGDFRAGDYVIQASYGNQWKDFSYGVTVKLLYSHMESYNSLGFAADLAAAYHNKEKMITVTAILRNTGAQLKPYVEGTREPIPMDLSVAFSKRLKKLPVRFNIVAHNLQKPNLRYDGNTVATTTNFFGQDEKEKKYIMDKIFRHFIFGVEVEPVKVFSIRLGYNHMRRQELQIGEKAGFGGITAGAGFKVKQFTIDYAFAKYSTKGSSNHISIACNLNEFGLKGN